MNERAGGKKRSEKGVKKIGEGARKGEAVVLQTNQAARGSVAK